MVLCILFYSLDDKSLGQQEPDARDKVPENATILAS